MKHKSTITRTTKYASLMRKQAEGQAPTRWDTKCWRNVDERTYNCSCL